MYVIVMICKIEGIRSTEINFISTVVIYKTAITDVTQICYTIHGLHIPVFAVFNNIGSVFINASTNSEIFSSDNSVFSVSMVLNI